MARSRAPKARRTARAKPARRPQRPRRTEPARRSAATTKRAGRTKRARTVAAHRRAAASNVTRVSSPSTLTLDRKSSAARSGRAALKERLQAHHETTPAITGGDVDADWELAYSSGDEAPGGDNPTPDQ
ncbi:MAG: hypothetical protein HY654_13255, partial [Acidobacteria bacterium]|nr:hypothetical protein [Acidobacteriota bacterium]